MLGLGNSLTSGGVAAGYSNVYSTTLDGSDDYFTVSSAPTLSADATISFWFNLGTQAATFKGLFASENYYTVGENNTIALQWHTDNYFRWVMLNGQTVVGGVRTWTPSSFSEDTWYHFALVLDDTANTVKAYQNGAVLSGTHATSGNTFADLANGIYMGQYKSNGSLDSDSDVVGLFDEVAIWTEALDADAIAAVYNSGEPIDLTEDSGNYDNSDNLVGYWRFEEGTGTSVTNTANSGTNDGTLVNATHSTDVPE